MCITPYIAEINGKPVAVPCGKCVQCLKDFQNGWSFRLTQECKKTILPIFVTLTYNDEHLPCYIDDNGFEHSCVFKSEVQRFLKRFRRYNPKLSKDCKYFAIGEYGSKKNRAHYHLVLILPEICWSDFKRKSLLLNYLRRRIENAWTIDGKQLGFVKVKPCEEEQIKYVTKYMNKLDFRYHLAPPFKMMSKSLGLNFLSDAMVKYYLTTFDRCVTNGRARINMPRYYRKKLDEYSRRHWMLKRAGLTYSEMLAPPKYQDGSLRSVVAQLQKDFCENFDHYYRLAAAAIAHDARERGYQVYEPNRYEVYQFVVNTNHILLDAVRINSEAINACCIKNQLKGYMPVTDEHLEYDDYP